MESFEEISQPHIYPASNKKKWFFIGIGIFIAVCIVVVGFGLFRFFSISQSLYSSLQEAESALKKSEFSQSKLALEDAHYSAQDLQSLLGTFSFVSAVPGIGGSYDEVQKISNAALLSIRPALQVVRISEQIDNVLQSTKEQRFQDASESQRMEVIQILLKSLPELSGAHAELTLALSQLQNISDEKIKGPLLGMKEKLEKRDVLFQEFLDSSVMLVKILPALAGYPKEKTYLFLLQNTNEVRATGGFIGTYGIVKVKNGMLTHFKTDNVYNLDKPATYLHVPAPEPYRKYGGREDREWFFRDSNWSPDFPTAAQKAQWFYEQEGGSEKLDGVISITPAVLVSLLKLTGPLIIDDLTFTSENVVDQLQYQVEKGYLQEGLPSSQRKEIVGTMARLVLEKIMNLPNEKAHDLYTLFNLHAQEKDILFFFNDPVMQLFARDAGWTGKVRSSEGDFLQVIDSNLISLKTDKVMDKKINYLVSEHKDGYVSGRVELTYTNTGDYTWETGMYKNYVRILIPEGSKIIETAGAQKFMKSKGAAELEISHEHGKMVVGAYFTVAPKETKTFFVEYQLPPKIYQDIARGSYTALFQKQSGISKHIVNAEFSFLHDISSIDTDIASLKKEQAHASFSTPTNTDHELIIKFSNK